MKVLDDVNKEISVIRNKSKNLQDTTEYDELMTELPILEDKINRLKSLISGAPEVKRRGIILSGKICLTLLNKI